MTTRIILADNPNSGSVPVASSLEQAELVINTADGRLFTKNASGQVVLLNSKNSNPISSSYAVTASFANVAASATGFNIQRTSVSVTSAYLSGSILTGSVALGKAFILYNVTTDTPARIRLYASSSFRDADVARPASTFASGESGLLTELVLSGSTDILNFTLSPIVNGANAEPTPTNNIAYTIQPYIPNSGSINLTFTRIELEG